MPVDPQPSRPPSLPPLGVEDQTLREALQMHPRPVAWPERLELLARLYGAGLRRFQVGSLVRGDRMPQMAHSEELISRVQAWPGVEVWALVLNRKGLERARQCELQGVTLSASLSPPHSQRNLACSVEQGLARCLELAGEALGRGLRVRMGLQCAFGGPLLRPPTGPELARVLRPFHDLGVRRLALADTAGRAQAPGLNEVLAHLRQHLPGADLGLHLHGNPGQLAANLDTAWRGGAAWVDATLEGRGGCPYLPGHPPANLPLEQAMAFLRGKGQPPLVDQACLVRVARHLRQILSYRKVVIAP